MKNLILTTVASLLWLVQTQAQLSNQGAFIGVSNGTTLAATGSIDNASGTIHTSGTLKTDLDIFNGLGATLSGNGTYQVGRDWIGGGLLTGLSTINLFGSAWDAYMSEPNPVYRLRLNKTGTYPNLTLFSNTLQVSNNLNFFSPNNKIILFDQNLRILSGATVTGISSSKFVVTNGFGKLQYFIPAGSSQVFHVAADLTTYNQATVKNSGTADYYAVRVLPTALTNGGSGSPIVSDAVNASWEVNDMTPGGTNFNLTTQWRAADQLAGFDKNWCAVTRYTGTGWDVNNGALGAAGGTISAPTRVRNANTADGYFAVMDGSLAPCGAPFAYTVTHLSPTSVNVSWAPIAGVTTYQFRYRLSPSGSYSVVSTVTSPNITLTGLAATTAYDFQIRSLCGTSYSSFSTPTTFTTGGGAATCVTPTIGTEVILGPTSAHIFWNYVSGATSYTFRFRVNGSSTWGSPVTVMSPERLLTGLAAGTTYQYQVRANCTSGPTAYVTDDFTTAPPSAIMAAEAGEFEASEAAAHDRLTIMPNPAVDEIFVQFDLSRTLQTLEVLNLDGQLLQRISGNHFGGNIQVSDLPAGLYLVRATYTEGTTEATKFMKVR